VAKKPKGSGSTSNPVLVQTTSPVSDAVSPEGSGKPIGIVPLQVMGCRCRCGHEWVAQGGEKPRVCPKCKSPNWDRPKRWTVKRAVPEGE
jgi:hypothetical protein